MQLPAAALEPNASADGKERMHQCERLGELLLKKPAATPHLVLCNRYDFQSLSSKWPAAKARGGSMSFATCDRDATQVPGHFQLNPPGRGSLGEFPRRSLGQYRSGYRRFARSLKFAQTPRGDGKAIPVTQH